MGAPAKFLFDLDFGARPSEPPPPVEDAVVVEEPAILLAEHERQLAAARTAAEAEGYRKGFAAAQAEAVADVQRRTAQALDRAAAGIDRLVAALNEVEARLEAEAVDVAVAVATRLAPELIAREPLAELAALVKDVIGNLLTTPHIVVRVNDAVYDAARERLTAIARSVGFDGRLIVLAEPHIKAGDCRIEWADGGVVRDRAATETRIAEAVGRYLAARLGPTDGTAPSGEKQ